MWGFNTHTFSVVCNHKKHQMTEPIDIIRQLADKFTEEHKKDHFSKMLILLREQLLMLDSLNAKRTFLKYIKTNIQHGLEVHYIEVHKFGKPDKPCNTEIHDNQFLFYIDQELKIIEKFEEKEKRNFLQQFDNNVLFIAIPLIVSLIWYFGYWSGRVYERYMELNDTKTFNTSTPILTDTLTVAKANMITDSTNKKNEKPE
jgi:hypothetical protein